MFPFFKKDLEVIVHDIYTGLYKYAGIELQKEFISSN